MTNAFYFTWNVLSVIKIFKFLQFFFFLPNILGWVVKMEAKVENWIIMTSWIVLHQIINCNFWTIQNLFDLKHQSLPQCITKEWKLLNNFDNLEKDRQLFPVLFFHNVHKKSLCSKANIKSDYFGDISLSFFKILYS